MVLQMQILIQYIWGGAGHVIFHISNWLWSEAAAAGSNIPRLYTTSNFTEGKNDMLVNEPTDYGTTYWWEQLNYFFSSLSHAYLAEQHLLFSVLKYNDSEQWKHNYNLLSTLSPGGYTGKGKKEISIISFITEGSHLRRLLKWKGKGFSLEIF